MAEIKISELPSLSTMTDAAQIPVVASGATHQITGANLKTYFSDTGNLEITGTVIEIAEGASETLINITPSGPVGGWAFLQLPTNDTANTANTRLHNAAGNVEIGTGDFSTGITNYTWIFDNTGNLTIPNDIISNTSIEIDNRISGNSADIRLFAADDIVLQARDRTAGSGTEGGDINIYAGDSAEDGDASGGDIQIFAGDGGAANVDFGGAGGFITIRSGQGGAAIGDGVSSAESGGDLTLQAGAAGDNNGNVNRGAAGGTVFITGGLSTGNLNAGGDVQITSGQGGANASAGQIELNIPISTAGPGGTWSFNYAGNLNLPLGGVVSEGASPTGLGNTIALTPSGGNDVDQQLLIYPTAGEGNHLHLTSGNLYNTELYLGNDDLYVKLANTGNVVINSNDGAGNSAPWTFSTNGILTLPGEGILRSIDDTVALQSLNTTTGNANSVYLGSSGGLGFSDQAIGGNWLEIFRSGTEPEIRVPVGVGNLLIQTASNTTPYVWNFGNTGSLTLPTISLDEGIDEQTVIQSQRKIIPPFRWSAVISGSTPTVIYNATDVNTTSMKVTVQIQHQGLGMEFFEVFATSTAADTYYTVSNRVAPPTIDASTVVVGLGEGNVMKITVTINSGAGTSWATYDAVEFGIPND